jgi:hypothetical protein
MYGRDAGLDAIISSSCLWLKQKEPQEEVCIYICVGKRQLCYYFTRSRLASEGLRPFSRLSDPESGYTV